MSQSHPEKKVDLSRTFFFICLLIGETPYRLWIIFVRILDDLHSSYTSGPRSSGTSA